MTEKYTYTGEGKLLTDISSPKPLKKSKKKETISEEIKTEEVKTILVEEVKTQKEIYLSLIGENKPFVIKISGNVVFDSEKDNLMNLIFEEDYFRISLQKFIYQGVNFKFKK